MPRRDAGFTLLEILVVLAIMGAVVGIAVSRGPMRSQGLQTRAAAGSLAQTLREARALAIARSEIVAVVIDPARHSFAADRGPVRRLAAGVSMSLLPGTTKGPGDTGTIRFSPDGSSSGGGARLGAGHKQLEIEVEWLTGRVRVADAH